jgi:hypothetical protein
VYGEVGWRVQQNWKRRCLLIFPNSRLVPSQRRSFCQHIVPHCPACDISLVAISFCSTLFGLLQILEAPALPTFTRSTPQMPEFQVTLKFRQNAAFLFLQLIQQGIYLNSRPLHEKFSDHLIFQWFPAGVPLTYYGAGSTAYRNCRDRFLQIPACLGAYLLSCECF